MGRSNDTCLVKVVYNTPFPTWIARTEQFGTYFGGACTTLVTTEADLLVNGNLLPTIFADTNLTSDVQPGMIDLYSILLHELGHAHSLKHVNDSNDIMWHQYRPPALVLPASQRKIQLADSPAAVDGGNYVITSALLINSTLCPSIHKMTIGAENCTWISVPEMDNPNINLNVFPNPVSFGEINISYQLENKSNVTISMFDLTEREIYYEQAIQFPNVYTKKIDIEHLPNGCYLIRVAIGQYQFVSKLIKL